jgi:hypothetical protein
MEKTKENYMPLPKKSNEPFLQRQKDLLYFKYLEFHSNQITLEFHPSVFIYKL